MKRLFNSSTAFLWVLIMATLVLLGGQAAGFDWEFSEKKGLGRLLAHPGVAAIEVLLAAMLILLPVFDYPYKKWVTGSVALMGIAFGMYILLYYGTTGMEFLLIFGANQVLYGKTPGQK
jgi:hypothetical protein